MHGLLPTLLLAATVAAASLTASAQATRPPADHGDARLEASMLVTGSLVIEPDGTVSSHELDRADEVPDYVVAHIARAVPRWRFEPVMVDGHAVVARAGMTLRMLATPLDDDDLAISLGAATFGERYPSGTDHVNRRRMRPPEFPGYALDRGASGTVYVVLKVGRDGRVADVLVEQVNLRVSGDPETMDRVRNRMSAAVLKAARRWTFTPPTTGPTVDDPHWLVRVPVEFTVVGRDRTEAESYGRWVAYVPGPRQSAPWVPEESSGNDAIAAGSLEQAGTAYRLTTPLQPEG